MSMSTSIDKKDRNAFTILELSIVIAILALIVGTSLSFIAARTGAVKRQATSDRMDKVIKSVESFVRSRGYLPCPADPTIAESDASFGLALGSSSSTTDGTAGACTAGNLLVSSDSTVVAGMVPVITLGLNPDYSVDGWNRRFTYVADQRFSRYGYYIDACSSASDVCTNKSGAIAVYDDAGGNLIADPSDISGSNYGAIVLLMSHGQNGYKAWKSQGGSTRLKFDVSPPDNSELENAHLEADDDTGEAYDSEFVKKKLTNAYDDIVIFRRKKEICDFPKNCIP